MWLSLDDLRCPRCGAFVHPLLETCPACGEARASRRQEASAGPIGAVRLEEAPETQRVARNLTLRYTMKVNAVGSSATDATLAGAVAHLADALTYRVAGDGIPPTGNATLTLRDEGLVVQRRPSGSLLAEVPLCAIVGTASQHGEATLHYAAGLANPSASGPTAHPGTQGRLRLTIANRGGLLASRARDDHYEALARWLAVLAAPAAERRWTEVGLAAYLVELGPAADDAAGAPEARGETSAAVTAVPGTVASPIQASLVELEGLRAAGLVADDEYATKRREILARL